MGKMKRLNNKGFAALEAVLIVVIVGLLAGVGYYVWHANKQTTDTLNAASKDAAGSPAKTSKKSTSAPSSVTTQQYITVQEWGVRAPITDGLTYTEHKQTVGGELFVGFTSTKLAGYKGCEEAGGIIGRYTANEGADDAGDSAASLAKSTPDKVKQVGDYYFVFTHDQAACSDDTTAQSLQTQNNNDQLDMMQHFQTY